MKGEMIKIFKETKEGIMVVDKEEKPLSKKFESLKELLLYFENKKEYGSFEYNFEGKIFKLINLPSGVY